MKSFVDFILICEEKKGRSGPKYNPVTPKPEKKKEKKPVETSNGQLPQE
jgi:hypothetical protein